MHNPAISAILISSVHLCIVPPKSKIFPKLAKTLSIFFSSHTPERTGMGVEIYGFQGAGGGGGVRYIGGTAEKIVFLSIPTLDSPDRATRAATRPAFPASVGSV